MKRRVKQPVFTHALGTTTVTEDGVKRELEMILDEENLHRIKFTTHWPNRKPVVTRIALTEIAMGMLAQGYFTLHANLPKWVVGKKKK